MEITKNNRISDNLEEYGNIAGVMELFGVKRVGRYSLRSLAAKALTVEWAARSEGSGHPAQLVPKRPGDAAGGRPGCWSGLCRRRPFERDWRLDRVRLGGPG